ncbi:hypothetical protein JYU04_01430 [Dehalococcoides mccartyi]|nr:hypothetical protein [Dehalococcoides mccartyi]
MNYPYRSALTLIISVTLIAIIASCSSGESDTQPTPTTESPTQPSATARPTITPVPTATNTPGPTPTPVPTATPSPTPTPTATPQPPDSYVNEMGRLFTEFGIDFSTLFVKTVGADQWDSAALGCPEPGAYNDVSEAPYTGLYYILSNGNLSWEYHSNNDDSIVIRCSEVAPSNASLVNIAQQADLSSSTKLTLMRRDFTTNIFEVRREMTPEDMARVIELFSQESQISFAQPCETVFRLDFETSQGTSMIEFICSEDYKAFDIYWNELHGTAPILGYIIGPYLTGNPIPTLPTETP